MTTVTPAAAAPQSPIEQLLGQIAEESNISILRWDDETLADFAARLEDELAQRVIEFRDFIDEIRALDLHYDRDIREGD